MEKTLTLPSRSEINLQKFILKATSKATQKDLIKVLQTVQERYGYLSKDSLRMVSSSIGVSLSKVYGVATFYHQFRLEPPGKYLIQVCMGTGCHAKGNADNYEYLKSILGLEPQEYTTKDKVFTLETARCFGCCSLAPVIGVINSNDISRQLYGHVDQKMLKNLLLEYKERAIQESVPKRKQILLYQKK